MYVNKFYPVFAKISNDVYVFYINDVAATATAADNNNNWKLYKLKTWLYTQHVI